MWAGPLAFLIATAFWPGLISSATLPRQAIVAAGVPLLMRVDPRDLDPRILWLLLFGVAWAIGSAQTVEAGFWLLVLTVAFIAGAGLRSLDGIMTGMALGLGVNAAICMAQLFGWQGIKQATVPAGLFFSREVLAELAAPVAVWWWIRCKNESGNSALGLFSVFYRGHGVGTLCRASLAFAATLPLILCGERVAILAAIAGLVYFWHQSRGAKSRRLIAEFSAELTALALFAALMLAFFGPERWLTALARVDIWRDAAAAITPFGHGLGWFKMTYPHNEFAHSDVLQMFAELGAGAVFFFAIPILCFAEKRGSDADRACLLAICIVGTFSFLLGMPASGFLAAVVTGYLGARRRGVCGRAPDGAGHGGAADGSKIGG